MTKFPITVENITSSTGENISLLANNQLRHQKVDLMSFTLCKLILIQPSKLCSRIKKLLIELVQDILMHWGCTYFVLHFLINSDRKITVIAIFPSWRFICLV
jgi:hypothetical protein